MVVLIGLLLLGVSSIAWTQAAQQGPPAATLDSANFTGKVTASPVNDVRATRIVFEPGARTNWHSHAGGQVILVERGSLIFQERGTGAKRGGEVRARETYVTEPNIVHWHGAPQSATLQQIAFSFGMTSWAEKVTDAQYAAAVKK
jgi:quercetin dioxygenase-like cupin family protein